MNSIISTYTKASNFLERAQEVLEQREAENNLILGIAMRLRDQPGWISTRPYLATVDDAQGHLELAAVITPPHNLLLAGAPDVPLQAIQALIENLRAGGWTPPGANIEKQLATRFVDTWQHMTGQHAEVKIRMRVYELRKVVQPAQLPPGRMRLAEMAELDMAVAWRAAFFRESLHVDPSPDDRDQVIHMINTKTLYLWDDGEAVSMAASARPTRHGATINSVYTPPALRQRGYASACVAALSQRMLDAGKTFCSLFTDLDYPTSNSIYQKIGYRALSDFMEYHFIE